MFILMFALSFPSFVTSVLELDTRVSAAEDALKRYNADLAILGDDPSIESLAPLEKQFNDIMDENERIKTELRRHQDSALFKLLQGKFPELDETSKFIFGVSFLFVSYVIGELSLMWGRFNFLTPKMEKALNHRVAKVATLENQIISQEFDRHENQLMLYSGIFALLSALFCAGIITIIEQGWSWSAVSLFFPSIAGTAITHYAGSMFGRNLDMIIELAEERDPQ